MTENFYPWRWCIWILCVLGWTTALLVPIPEDGPWQLVDPEINFRFFLSKGLHLSMYSFLTIGAAWVRAPIRYRFLLIFFLMGHATLTEMLQLLDFIDRGGRLTDVALDHIGITVGMVLSWRWWTRE